MRYKYKEIVLTPKEYTALVKEPNEKVDHILSKGVEQIIVNNEGIVQFDMTQDGIDSLIKEGYGSCDKCIGKDVWHKDFCCDYIFENSIVIKLDVWSDVTKNENCAVV